jgi:hypothetical protein
VVCSRCRHSPHPATRRTRNCSRQRLPVSASQQLLCSHVPPPAYNAVHESARTRIAWRTAACASGLQAAGRKAHLAAADERAARAAGRVRYCHLCSSAQLAEVGGAAAGRVAVRVHGPRVDAEGAAADVGRLRALYCSATRNL